jgi:hypothetical protein
MCKRAAAETLVVLPAAAAAAAFNNNNNTFQDLTSRRGSSWSREREWSICGSWQHPIGFFLGDQWVDLFLACGIHSIPEATVMKRNRDYGVMRDFMGVLGRSSGETEGISAAAAAAAAAFLSSSETTPPLPPPLRVRQIGDQASSKTFSSFPIPSIFPHGQEAAAAAAGFAIGQAAGAGLGVNSRPNFAISGTTAALGALGNSLSEKPGSRGGGGGGAAAGGGGGGGGGGGFTGFSGGSLHQKTRPKFTTSAMLAGGGGSGKKDHQVKVVVADDSRIMMGGAALPSSSSAAAVGAGAAVSEGGRERAADHANGKPLEELAASDIQQLSREDCWRLILEVGMYHQVSDLLCFVWNSWKLFSSVFSFVFVLFSVFWGVLHLTILDCFFLSHFHSQLWNHGETCVAGMWLACGWPGDTHPSSSDLDYVKLW